MLGEQVDQDGRAPSPLPRKASSHEKRVCESHCWLTASLHHLDATIELSVDSAPQESNHGLTTAGTAVHTPGPSASAGRIQGGEGLQAIEVCSHEHGKCQAG
ncbi:unnamed protein product [Mortierella alpina]